MISYRNFAWLPLAAMLLQGPTAFAGPGYDGPAVDYNFVNTKPARYAECREKYRTAPGMVYDACEFGRDEAERMAHRFAGGKGRIQGYLRGYAWGLYKMSRAYRNDASEMAQGEKLVDGMGQYMDAGLEAGRRAGVSLGQTWGRTEAINRFESVMDTGKRPDSALRVPAPHPYQEEANPFLDRVLQGKRKDERAILRELGPGQLKVYDTWDDIYLGERKPLSVWDLWFEDGVYVFPKWSWFERDEAMQTWLSRPIDTKPAYEALKDQKVVDQSGVEVLDPATGLAYDLQGIFRSAFMNSYEYYVNYYFSAEFKQNLDDGQVAGETVGALLGKQVARDTGLERAFNKKYNESARATYRDAYTASYTDTFESTFEHYANNPVLSLSFDEIIGSVNDGILQAGEAFSVLFSVRNVGGVATDLNVSVGGRVTDAKPATLSINASQSRQYRVNNIARIVDNARPQEQARIVLKVNDQESVLSALVQKMIELKRADARLAVTDGSGQIQVVVQNVSTVRTPSEVVVQLLLNGQDVDAQAVGHIDGGDARDVVLSFANMDPLALINGAVEAKLVVLMNGAVMDDRTALTLKAQSREAELVKYYNQLVNGKGFVPGHVDREDRILQVQNQMIEINLQETRQYAKNGGNLWKNDPSSTMVGKLVQQFRGGYQSDEAKDRYHKLGKLMWDARRNLKKFMFWGAKRKSYEKLCRELSSTGKYR